MSLDIRVTVKAYDDGVVSETDPTPVILTSDDDDEIVVIEIDGVSRRVIASELLEAVAKFQ